VTVSADATTEPSAGAEVTRNGAVLSTRMPVFASLRAFPNWSETVARTS